jgi:serine/threonine protein kinase
MKTTDPTVQYEVVKKIGQGGFAKVFEVRRKSDGTTCALKFVEPKNEKERKIIINEVGLMYMCNDNNLMLRVHEAYNYKERLWIFCELMDDALTAYV